MLTNKETLKKILQEKYGFTKGQDLLEQYLQKYSFLSEDIAACVVSKYFCDAKTFLEKKVG